MEYTYISSRSNPTVTEISKLSDRRARDEKGLFLAEGRKLCSESAACGEAVYALVLGNEKGAAEDLLAIAEKSRGKIFVLSEGAFSKLSQDKTPDGIILVLKKPDVSEYPKQGERIVMLDSVRDPGNVGTIVRSAAAFGFDRVVLCDCADVFSPKAIRSSMGAVFKMKFTTVQEPDMVIEAMHRDGRRIIAAGLGENGITIGNGKEQLFSDDCPVIGNEGHGISDSVLSACDKTVKIPMSGKTESLNAAAAAAVLLWEYGKLFGGLS